MERENNSGFFAPTTDRRMNGLIVRKWALFKNWKVEGCGGAGVGPDATVGVPSMSLVSLASPSSFPSLFPPLPTPPGFGVDGSFALLLAPPPPPLPLSPPSRGRRPKHKVVWEKCHVSNVWHILAILDSRGLFEGNNRADILRSVISVKPQLLQGSVVSLPSQYGITWPHFAS